MEEIKITTGDYAVGKEIVNLHFPGNLLIAMIKRQGKNIIPKGSTVIEAGTCR